jgi:hypothetical protein
MQLPAIGNNWSKVLGIVNGNTSGIHQGAKGIANQQTQNLYVSLADSCRSREAGWGRGRKYSRFSRRRAAGGHFETFERSKCEPDSCRSNSADLGYALGRRPGKRLKAASRMISVAWAPVRSSTFGIVGTLAPSPFSNASTP